MKVLTVAAMLGAWGGGVPDAPPRASDTPGRSSSLGYLNQNPPRNLPPDKIHNPKAYAKAQAKRARRAARRQADSGTGVGGSAENPGEVPRGSNTTYSTPDRSDPVFAATVERAKVLGVRVAALHEFSDAEVLAEYRLRFPGTGDQHLDQIASTVELGSDATPAEITERVAALWAGLEAIRADLDAIDPDAP